MSAAGPARVLELLESGPQPLHVIAEACGYEPGDPRGRAYVKVNVHRLRQRRRIRNAHPPGSHRGALYVVEPLPEHVCLWCGDRLSRYNRGDHCAMCEARQRSMSELPWPRLLRLPGVEVPAADLLHLHEAPHMEIAP